MANKQYLIPGLGIYQDSSSKQYLLPGLGIVMGGPPSIAGDAGSFLIAAGMSDPSFYRGRRIHCNFTSVTTTLWSEDCADISDWYNCGNGGLSYADNIILGSDVDPSSVFVMQGILGGIVPPPAYNVGLTACRSNWWPGSGAPFENIPSRYTFNISLFHPVGGLSSGHGNLGKFQATLSNGTLALDVRWGSDGLTIGSGIGSDTLIPGVVLEETKQAWSFEVTGTNPALATVNVRLNGTLIASNVDCSWESATAYDSLVIEMHPKSPPGTLHKSQILSTTYINSMDITYEVETAGIEQNYDITGTDASLVKIPLLHVASGYYDIITQEPITLAHGYPPLIPDAGNYVITGTSVDMPRGVFIEAESDVFSITGTAAVFDRTLLLSAAPTALNIIGYTVGLFHPILFSTNPDSFTLSGTDATLFYAYGVMAEPTSYIITTTNTTSLNHNAFVFHAIINSDPHRLDIIPTDPTLLEAEFKVVPDPGAYVLSGQDLSAYRRFTLIMESINYIISGQDISFSFPDHILSASDTDYRIREAPNQELTFRWGYAIVPTEDAVSIETRPVGATIRTSRHRMTERDHTAMTRRQGISGFNAGRVIPNAEG